MATSEFEIRSFNLDELKTRRERSKYPFQELQVGDGFSVPMPTSGISGRVCAENKKSDKAYVTRADKNSTPERPKSWVIRIR